VTRRNWRRQTVVGAGFVLSVFFLWLALRNVDGASLSEAFAAISYVPVAACAGALSLGIALRGVRWRVIADFPREQQRNFFRATNLGVLTNLLFPGRAGEFVRVITLAKLSHSSLPVPLASALIDRLVDVSVLVVSASVIYWLFPVGGLLGTWLTVVLGIGCVITLLVVLYSRSSGFGDAMISRLASRWLQRWPLRPEVFLVELCCEFRRLLSTWLSNKLVFLAGLILCVDYVAIAALIQAFGLSLPVEAPLVLWVFLAAGSALPSAPGYVGVYQVAAVWALSLFSVTAPTAVAIATVLQITTLAVALVMAGPGTAVVFKRFLLGRSPPNEMVG
jgi:uncharacterized membrane protein YbhN (UPF0104 family)